MNPVAAILKHLEAVKNFRYLDRTILTEGLEGGIGKKVGKLVWHNRRPVKEGRTGMLKALQSLGTSYRRQVVIIQPRLHKHGKNTREGILRAVTQPASANSIRCSWNRKTLVTDCRPASV